MEGRWRFEVSNGRQVCLDSHGLVWKKGLLGRELEIRLNKTFAETAVAMSILQRKRESLCICLKMYSALEIQYTSWLKSLLRQFYEIMFSQRKAPCGTHPNKFKSLLFFTYFCTCMTFFLYM